MKKENIYKRLKEAMDDFDMIKDDQLSPREITRILTQAGNIKEVREATLAVEQADFSKETIYPDPNIAWNDIACHALRKITAELVAQDTTAIVDKMHNDLCEAIIDLENGDKQAIDQLDDIAVDMHVFIVSQHAVDCEL